MEIEDQAPSGPPVVVSDDTGADKTIQEQSQTHETVNRSTYLKTLNQKKQQDVANAELKAELDALKMQQLEADGNKDAIIESLKTRVTAKDEQYTELNKKLKRNEIMSQVSSKAAGLGCRDIDKMIKLIDYGSLPVDPETFKADGDAVDLMLENAKKDMPYFFGKEAPRVADLNQSNQIPTGKPAATIEDLGREDLAKAIASGKFNDLK